MLYIILIIVIIIIIIVLFNEHKDGFSGGLTQLHARGPEDQYLITGSEKYWLPYFWREFMFNNPVKKYYYY